eukprot:scaffold2339_cov54-Attheya_sp.AAC.3
MIRTTGAHPSLVVVVVVVGVGVSIGHASVPHDHEARTVPSPPPGVDLLPLWPRSHSEAVPWTRGNTTRHVPRYQCSLPRPEGAVSLSTFCVVVVVCHSHS